MSGPGRISWPARLAGAAAAIWLAACTGGDGGVASTNRSSDVLDAAPEDLCSIADLAWQQGGDGVVCEGPWTYEQYGATEGEHSSCGIDRARCLERNLPVWVEKENTFHNDFVVPARTPCAPPPEGQEPVGCPPNGEAAWDICKSLSNQERSERSQYPGLYRNVEIVSYYFTTIEQVGINEYRSTCRTRLRYEQNEGGQGECVRYAHQVCTHADPSAPRTAVTTAPGLSRQQVIDAHAAQDQLGGQISPAHEDAKLTCTSAQEPELSLGARFDRLELALDDPEIVPPSSGSLRATFIRRAKLAYEMMEAEEAAPRRSRAHALYRDHPTTVPSCGRNVPTTAAVCTFPGDWRLRLCTRLTSNHVGASLIDLDYDDCLVMAHDLDRAIDDGSCGGGPGDTPTFLTGGANKPNEKPGTKPGDLPGDDCSDFWCPDNGNAAFTAALSLDVHTRLLEHLLVAFGVELARSSDPEEPHPDYDHALIARTLSHIDQWHIWVAPLVPAEDARRQDELALIVNKFWQVAHGMRLSPSDEGTWLRHSLYGELEQALDEADTMIENGAGDEARAAISEALELADMRGLALNRAVLQAAFQDVERREGAVPAMQGMPLLAIVGDSFAPLVERMEALSQYHDVGCALARCAAISKRTKLSTLWEVLSRLTRSPDEPGSLADAVGAAEDLSGWGEVFAAVVGGQSRLLSALAAMEETALGATELERLITLATERAAAYDATGQFLGAIGNDLYTGVHSEQRADVLAYLAGLSTQIDDAASAAESRMISLVHDLMRVRDAETSLAQLEATRERVASTIADLQQREGAYRQVIGGRNRSAAEQEETSYEQLMAAWARIDSAVDANTPIYLPVTETFQISAADAKFSNWSEQGVPQVAAAAYKGVKQNQVVSIAVPAQDRWSPSCALRQARMIDPDRALGAARDTDISGETINANAVPVGPEGYSLSWSGSSYDAVSANAGVSTRVTAGVKLEACMRGGVPIGYNVDACAYLDMSVSAEAGTGWQHGSEDRTSVSFSSGIYLPNTPFEAPAGSLVVVEMPEGETSRDKVRDIHLVRAPHTSIVVAGDSDLYLVVNDRLSSSCGTPDASPLNVTIGKYVTQGDVAPALVKRMARTLGIVRQNAPLLIEKGEITALDIRAIETQAMLDQIGEDGEVQLPVSAYDDSLKVLFQAFLAKELARLEAMVRIANIERELAVQQAEYWAISVAMHNGKIGQYMVGLLPKWTVRGLRLRELREASTLFARSVRLYVAPMLRLWYPEVAAGAGGLEEVGTLLNLDLDSSVVSLAQALGKLGAALELRITNAQLPYPDNDETKRSVVSLRFARSDLMDEACKDVPSARCRLRGEPSTFRWATSAAANALWASLGSGELTFTVRPEDLYVRHEGSAALPCRRRLPVVLKVALVFSGTSAGAAPAPLTLNGGEVPEEAPMRFVSDDGVHDFRMQDPIWRALDEVAVLRLPNYVNIQAIIEAMPDDVRGISPFSTFRLPISPAAVQEHKLDQAKSIDLVMLVEATRSATEMPVAPCLGDE